MPKHKISPSTRFFPHKERYEIFDDENLVEKFKIFVQDFVPIRTIGRFLSNGSFHENLRAARQISCAASLHGKLYLKYTKNAHSMYGGECHAAIAKAAAAVTRVQSPSQEVGSSDNGLGLLCFDVSSAETDFWWPEDEQ